MGSRLVVGHRVLVPAAGVRVPSPQPYRTQAGVKWPFTPVNQGFFIGSITHFAPPII